MEKYFDVLYYYYYYFYKNIRKEDQPNVVTIFVMSAQEAFTTVAVLDLYFVYVFRVNIISNWFGMPCTALYIVVNYFYFWRSGRATKLVQGSAPIYRNKSITRLIVILSFFFSFVIIFIAAVIGKLELVGHL
ncbi:MAG: hypothetical protein LWX56_11635 [Ignavibacteria bacterium]|nr:hypothetical protein [Ignavibacteria bacterium]